MSEVETGALGAGRIEPRELEHEMRSSYLDYAMSVIVGRALPDVRDGLKPVHPRVLYGMHEAGLQPNRPYKKAAATAGDVMGRYFPTGALSVGRSGIRDAYRTGRGRVVMRARAHIEELRGGKSAIVITELPYGVKKGGDNGVIRKIAELVQEKTLTEISDLADHSDRTGMRIHVELKRDAVPQVALNKLFKHTPLQSTFGYNAVALVDGVPRTLSLLELVTHYLDFQREVVIRRSKDELDKAEKRAHVLEGYLIALDNIDAIVALIRGASDTDDARTQLQDRFSLSEIQAQAILDLRLARLTGLARQEIEAEFKDLRERIAELRMLLGDPARIDALIREELLELRSI